MVTMLLPNQVYLGDALQLLPLLPDSSVDLILTDPPYFLDKLNAQWDPKKVATTTQNQQVASLPSGMRFDPQQGIRLQSWYGEVSTQLFRVLKPGGFFFSFSSPRLVHRMAVAVEDAGFHIRDMFLWLYTESQPKAQSLQRYAPPEAQTALAHWKTPQVKGNYEPIIVAQKPPVGTLVNNFLTYGVGLFNFDEKLEGGYFPSNVLVTEDMTFLPPMFLVPKPKKVEKGTYNTHPTVKPLHLLRYLIRLASPKGALVLDPFLGSGSTAVAALLEERHYLGFELNSEYLSIAKRRLAEALTPGPT